MRAFYSLGPFGRSLRGVLHCAASYIRGGGANRRLYDYNSMHGVSFHEKYEAVIIIGGGGSEVSEACICGIIEFG